MEPSRQLIDAIPLLAIVVGLAAVYTTVPDEARLVFHYAEPAVATAEMSADATGAIERHRSLGATADAVGTGAVEVDRVRSLGATADIDVEAFATLSGIAQNVLVASATASVDGAGHIDRNSRSPRSAMQV